MTTLQLKRAYDAVEPEDGFRVYVDRLWPRGLSHETFHYDVWEKEIAPSSDLRHLFHEDPEKNAALFETGYEEELKRNPALEGFVDLIAAHPVVTLIYSSHDEKENNAVVLAKTLVSGYPDKFTY